MRRGGSQLVAAIAVAAATPGAVAQHQVIRLSGASEASRASTRADAADGTTGPTAPSDRPRAATGADLELDQLLRRNLDLGRAPAARRASALGVDRIDSDVRTARWLSLTQDAPGESGPALQSQAGSSADEIARTLANPNNSLASLTFKNQFRWYTGDLPNADDQFNYTLLFQPVFPFSLGETANGGKQTFFARPAFPLLVEQPVFDAGTLDFDGTTALGDIGFDIGYGVTEKDGFIWAAGMVGTLPTATDSDVGGGQLRLGPEALIGKIEDWGVVGFFPAHQWNVTGWNDDYFATTRLQPVLKFLPGDGWSVGTGPEILHDWASSEWTVPLNLAISKTLKIAGTPWKVELEVNYFLEQPDAFGPEWMIGINITPVVPNFIEGMIRGR